MTAMNNSLTNLSQYQQRTQNDTTCALHVFHQSQQDHANDSLIDDISAFHGKPELHFDRILKLENTAAVTK